jgi:hypothetical protein
VIAAIDAAVTDGVEVINLSLAGGLTKPYFNNPTSIAHYYAATAGVSVVAAAGNYGPWYSSLGDNVGETTILLKIQVRLSWKHK